jgi:hypothetical protein
MNNTTNRIFSHNFIPTVPCLEKEVDKLSKTPAQIIAREALNTSLDKSADLTSKSINVPQQLGFWNLIKIFFNRHFGEIKKEDKNQAEKIGEHIERVKQNIEQILQSIRYATNEERTLAKTFPTKKTIDISEKHLTRAHNQINLVKQHLQALKNNEFIAIDLANKHATYDALPGQISKLEIDVAYLEARVQVTEKLFNIEVAMSDYRNQGTWVQFIKVREKKNALGDTLRNILANPNLKTEIGSQKFLAKASWEGIYQLIKSAFPGLQGKVERLWDGVLVMHKQRIQALDQQAETLKALILQYKGESNRINSLENSLYSDSLMAKISRVVYPGEDNLKKALTKAQDDQIATYKEIKKAAQFNPEELKWLAQIGRTNSDQQKLSSDLEAIRHEISVLDVRQKMADQMNALLKKLSKYSGTHRSHLSVSGLDATKRELIEKEIKTLQSGIQELAQNVKDWQIKTSLLPKEFRNMKILDQLKNVISIYFPILNERNQVIFRLIEKTGLHEDLNHALSEDILGKKEQIIMPMPEPSSKIEEKEVEERVQETEELASHSKIQWIGSPPPTCLPPPLPKDSLTSSKTTSNAIAEQISQQFLTESSSKKEGYQIMDVEPQLLKEEEQEKQPLSFAQQSAQNEEELNTSTSTNESMLEKQEPEPLEGRSALMEAIKKGKKLKKTGFSATVTDTEATKTEATHTKVETPYRELIRRINTGEKLDMILKDEKMKKEWENLQESERLELTLKSALNSRYQDTHDDKHDEQDSEWMLINK